MKDIGILRIDEIVENKDGSATIIFSNIAKELKRIIKKSYHRKRWSDKLFRRFIIEGLYNGMKKDTPELMKKEKLTQWIKDIEQLNIRRID